MLGRQERASRLLRQWFTGLLQKCLVRNGSDATKILTHINKFGRNANVDQAAVPIADDGVTLANWQASAAAATNIISSDNADNGATATGALTCIVHGLDANYQYVTEEVTLNGSTQVVLNTAFLRVWRIVVDTAGSGNTNAGAIDVRHSTTVLARIPIGNNQTEMAMFTVPTGHHGVIEDVYGELEKAGGATTYVTFRLWTQAVEKAKRLRLVYSATAAASTHVTHEFGGDREGIHGGVTIEPG
ncbi:hypothetical protein LCGC14_2821180, partial [marine sediment metagenome]